MELWLVYAALAYLLWAITNIVDKVFLNRYFKNPVVYCVFGGIFQIIVLVLLPYFKFASLSGPDILFGLASGALFFAALLPYFKALSQDDATIVVPLGSLTPVLVLIASFVFLGEHLDMGQWAAFALFVAGGFLLSVKGFAIQKIQFTLALRWVLLSMMLFSGALILIKMTFAKVPFFEGFVLLRLGTFLAALCFFAKSGFRKKASESYKGLSRKAKAIFSSNQAMGILGQLFFNLAIAAASISLVNAAQGLQYLFLFAVSIPLSLYLPNVFKERLDKGSLIRKGIAILLIAVAICLVNV